MDKGVMTVYRTAVHDIVKDYAGHQLPDGSWWLPTAYATERARAEIQATADDLGIPVKVHEIDMIFPKEED